VRFLVLLVAALVGVAAGAADRPRIVSLAPHLTEIAYAAGAGPALVGAVEYSDYPEAARRLPRIGDAFRLDYEGIVALRPDFAVAWQSGTPAGAIAQLEVWAERLGIECVSGAPGGDPAAVAFDAIEAATRRGADTVIIDTAGRLHTQEGLMDELRKVTRVIARKVPGAPHETLLVLDGTVGQNALQQGRLFVQAALPTGVVVTKLDGSARGGAVAAVRRELNVPIRFIGLGETLEDLAPFDATAFAQRLLAGDEEG